MVRMTWSDGRGTTGNFIQCSIQTISVLYSGEVTSVGFPPSKGIPISLKKTDPRDITRATPEGIKQQLDNIKLRCPDTVKAKLSEYINNITSQFPDSPTRVPTWLITETAPTLTFRAGELVAGARGLVPKLRVANSITQNFFGCLASTNPGTQDFLRAALEDDSVAEDFLAKVHQSHTETLNFLDRTIRAGHGAAPFLKSVKELGSPALDILAQIAVHGMQPAANGTWQVAENLGPYPQLMTIQAPDNWKKLQNHFGSDFDGQNVDFPDDHNKYTTVDAFENLFTQLAFKASAALVEGLAKDDTEATLANRIKGDAHVSADYDPGWESLVLMLGENYNPATGYADAVGVLAVDYKILIKDYRSKQKDDPNPQSDLSISTRAVLYNDPCTLCRDYNYVRIDSSHGWCEDNCPQSNPTQSQ